MIRICLFDGRLVCKLSTYVIVLGWERHLEAPKSYDIFIVFVPSYHYYGSYSSFVEDFIASNLNYGRWRTQIPTRAFESHYENLMQSSLTQTKLTARAFSASRHCPGYLQPPTETPRCSYSMMLWRTVAPQQRHQDREDRLYAGCEIRTRGARKRVPANQPAEQEPQPQTSRRDTKQGCDPDYCAHCVDWGRVDLPAKPKCIRQAMHGGMIGYLLYPLRPPTSCRQSLLNEWRSRSVSNQRAEREFQPAELAATTMIWCGRCEGHIDLCGTDAGLLDSVSILSVCLCALFQSSYRLSQKATNGLEYLCLMFYDISYVLWLMSYLMSYDLCLMSHLMMSDVTCSHGFGLCLAFRT